MTSDPVDRFLQSRGYGLSRRAGLRPRTGAEIIDAALRTYQAAGWPMLRVCAVPAALILAVLAFVNAFVLENFGWIAEGRSLMQALGDSAAALAVAVFVGGPLVLGAGAYGAALCVRLAADIVAGELPDERRAVRETWANLPSILWVAARHALSSLFGFLATGAFFIFAGWLTLATPENSPVAGLVFLVAWFAFLPAIIWFVIVEGRLGLSVPVVVLERVAGPRAGRRSKELMSKSQGIPSGAGTMGSLYVAILMAAFALGVALNLAVGQGGDWAGFSRWLGPTMRPLMATVQSLLPWFLIVWLLLPAYGVTLALLYYDRRMRREGYDIETLIEDARRARRVSRFQL